MTRRDAEQLALVPPAPLEGARLRRGSPWRGPRDQTLSTPWEVVRAIEARPDVGGPFELDVCAAPGTAKAPRFFTEADDGLAQPWDASRVWLQPPYDAIAPWVRRAADEVRAGRAGLVVALLPSRTGSAWFQWVLEHDAARVEFLRGRVTFNGAGGSPFEDSLLLFFPSHDRRHA